MKLAFILPVLAACAVTSSVPLQAAPEPAALKVPARLPDLAEPLAPSEVRLQGYLGQRVASSEKNRLLRVDEEELLAGFRNRPGKQAWVGEHVGKWLHAATLAWVNTGDLELAAKTDRVAKELIKTQEPDGYLGTYTPDRRFGLYPRSDWDVWVHKYDLIGLLTHYRYTGDPAALEACRKIGDLLVHTFGPGKKSILTAGTHVGMAATSVLEPMVLLYRATGDERYLDFSRYLVSAWDEPNGPKIIRTLATEKSVSKTGNAKAYEMLSNLVGLCELARATGERRYLEAPLAAWQDITAHHLYLTGSASSHEHFHADYELPNQQSANVGETCVTVTWIQLNAHLLRLTGEARYGDELERSYYNHLAAAQRPDGTQWCYYTSLEGTKPYGGVTNCCLSSGPRGMALAPQLAYLRYRQGADDGIAVNLFDTSRVQVTLGGQAVTLQQESAFPRSGSSTLTLHTPTPAYFGLRFRSPAWARNFTLRVEGDNSGTLGLPGNWATLPARRWKDGDRVTATWGMPARLVPGQHGNEGRAALTWGPLVLAYDEKRNPGLPPPRALALVEAGTPPFALKAEGLGLVFETRVRSAAEPAPRAALFVPFAEAGSDGGRYQVWLRAPGAPLPPDTLFAFARESRSRRGNATGSICDDDPGTLVVTFNSERAEEDWFAVQRDAAVTVRRIVFAHGRTYHDGGWFDTSAGKPRVEIQREKGGPWEKAGVLEEYPATTATDARGLKDGQLFTVRLSQGVAAWGIRVAGKPASGDNPKQSFSSCAELQAFPE